MNNSVVEIFTPRYVGGRFDEHRLPLELLEDLYALQLITIELAKYLFKEANSGRERIPRNFTSAVSFELSQIEPGSAMPSVQLVVEKAGLFDHENLQYFQKGSELLKEIVQAAQDNRDLISLAPKSALVLFDKLGSKLKEDEYIEFTPKNPESKARLDRLTRRRIIQASTESGEYTENCELRGLVSEIDLTKRTFIINLINGKRLNSEYEEFLESVLLDALSSFRTSEPKKVCLAAKGKFTSSGFIKEVMSIESVAILESRDVGYRLDEIGLLERGWFDGDGFGFDKVKLKKFHSLFESHFASELLLPNIFPIPEGLLLLEWSIGHFEVSLEVELSNFTGVLNVLDCSENRASDQNVELALESDWKKVNDVISRIWKI